MTELLTILVLLSSSTLFAQTANELFQKCAQAYAKAEMYIDSGKVLQEFYEMEHPFDNAKYFKTAFSRKGQFNYEYYDVGKSNSLWVINRSAEAKVQSWWGITNHLETNMSLDGLLSAAKGVSAQTSTIVPELLFPQNDILGGPIFNSIREAKIDGLEEVNGTSCYKISGSDVVEGNTSIWISKTDFLIRKVQNDKSIQNFRVKSTYDIYPVIPTSINQSLFEFKPNRKVKL